MSDSRESSPEWLRSFQVPSHSPLTLSSDSKSLHDDSPSVEDKIDDEGSSPKSPTHTEVSKSKSTGLGRSRAKSSPRITLEAVTLKLEDEMPSRRKKKGKKKEQEGGKEEKKVEIMNDSNIDKHIEHKKSIHSLWALSSESESCHEISPKREDHIDQVETSQPRLPQVIGEGECSDRTILDHDGKSPSKKASKEKSSQKPIDVEGHTPVKGEKTKGSVKEKDSGGDVKVEEEETSERLVEPNVSSSRLPLMLSEKVHRTKALIECQGDSIDLSGDVGSVGRIIVSDSPSGGQEMYLDLKGTIYKTSIVPCRTFCIVSFGQTEAKVEAIMNDFIQLKPQSNVYEAETMVEGTLDGFSFDSDDETGKIQKATHETDQNDAEEQANGKSKGKADKKKSNAAEKKRGRSTGAKPQPKAARKKAPASKKAKTKK